jgi:[ribosomal protein S5]-alanine N-acetyltransferase
MCPSVTLDQNQSDPVTMESLNTHRLNAISLRRWDFRELYVMHQDSEVMKYMGGVKTEEQTNRWLTDHLDHSDVYGFGCWIFRDEADALFVGRGLLRHSQLGNVDEVELSHGLVSQYWEERLATEMAKAIVAIGVEHLKLSSLVALVDEPNTVSRRVAEKVGFRFERNTIWKSLPTMLFRFDRSRWTEDNLAQ